MMCNGPKDSMKSVKMRVKGYGCEKMLLLSKSDLSRIKWGDTTRCVGVMELYGDCSARFMLCKDVLKCKEVFGKKKYLSPKTAVLSAAPILEPKLLKPLGNVGDKCDNKHYKCKPNLMCGGPKNAMKCVETRGKGYGCDKYICFANQNCLVSSGYTNRCVEIMGLNEGCSSRFKLCRAGLMCTDAHSAKKSTAEAKLTPIKPVPPFR